MFNVTSPKLKKTVPEVSGVGIPEVAKAASATNRPRPDRISRRVNLSLPGCLFISDRVQALLARTRTKVGRQVSISNHTYTYAAPPPLPPSLAT